MFKHKLISFIFLITLTFLVNEMLAQPCHDFLSKFRCRVEIENGYKPYGQSKSAMVLAKKTFQYKLVLYGGKDYKIGVCTENGYSPVHYKIINANTKKLLYDNMTDEYIESVGFSNEKTQNIIIEITVLAENIEIEDAEDLRVCVGINIWWKKMPQIGF